MVLSVSLCLLQCSIRTSVSIGAIACTQEVYRSRREAKERRTDAWLAGCEEVRQARADAAAAVAAAEHGMAIARSQQEYDRAKGQLAEAKAGLHQANAARVR